MELSRLSLADTEAAARRCLRKRCPSNFAKFTGKHLCQNIFFSKDAGLQLYLKRDSRTGVFL